MFELLIEFIGKLANTRLPTHNNLATSDAHAEKFSFGKADAVVKTTKSKLYSKPSKIFIGHGQSNSWIILKDFLQDRLSLSIDEFNHEPSAGLSTKERLEGMLEEAAFAFIVMTAEDEHSDGKLHARENVVHEAGLFQGRLGFRKAILLVEDGCEEFSNIRGLTQIRFPLNSIMSKSEEIRKVLERENILK